jgi:hypothetical protein
MAVSSAAKNRKKIQKEALRRLSAEGITVAGPTRWVHGVLYDAGGRELARETPHARGVDGLAKPSQASRHQGGWGTNNRW